MGLATPGGRPGPQAFWAGRAETEEKDVLQELRAIRHMVRQTWVMMIVLLVVVVVPTVVVGCSLLGVVLMELLPH